MIAGLKRKIATASHQAPLFYLLLIPAWLLLGFSRAIILLVSFRRFAHWLGVSDGIAPRSPLVSAAEARRAQAVGTAIRVAAGYTPWRSNCFPQALTAAMLLRASRVPYALFFGIANGEDEMAAHSWVVAGPVAVTGGRSFRGFIVVSCFVAKR